MTKNVTYLINLKKRTERRQHSFKQFKGKPEFALEVVEAIENENGALGLWQTIVQIVQQAIKISPAYIIICEDDHQFTHHYNKDLLLNAIVEAQQKDADILSGGVSWFNDALQISPGLFWVDKFTGTQFIVIYRNFFETMLQACFLPGDTADKKIAELTANKFCMYPFISIQKEFGYSDATTKNNTDGYVTQIFNDTSEKLGHLVKVASFYQLELHI